MSKIKETMESPLQTALKVKRNRGKTRTEIRVCDDCSMPLIGTFAFPYCESYCLNCGAKGGMFGTGKDIPITRELIFQEKLIKAIWKVIYGKKGLLPNGKFGRSNCKKDNGSCNDHRQHLTEAEKEWDKIAVAYLEHFNGGLLKK